MVFTLNALITKPANSFAPMILVYFLHLANYADYNKMKKATFGHFGNSSSISNATIADEPITATAQRNEHFDDLFDMMFLLACVFPLICIIVEGLCLAPYRLKFRHRREIDTIPDREIKSR